METIFIYYSLGVILYFLINFGFANLITEKSKKLSSNRSRIFWACLILSPFFGVLLAILDELTETRANLDELTKSQSDKLLLKEEEIKLDTKVELNENQLYVEKGSKRIIIYVNEKDDYINDGWEVVN